MPGAYTDPQAFHPGKPGVLKLGVRARRQLVGVPLVSFVASRRFFEKRRDGQPEDCHVLLRKEVIQPHLPVRLPCYDFVPIASPTFDGSPPYGLGHRLRVLPTFVT